MRSQRFLGILARVLIVGLFSIVLSLAACGGGGPSGPKNLVIATELPVTSDDAAQGLPTQYGADLAISQNAKLDNGYTLSVIHDNYEAANGSGADTTVAQTNVNKLVSNSAVVGVLGPFNSGVARVIIPTLQGATLVAISPTNTNPGLTKEQYSAANGITYSKLHPAGKPNAYFRICGTDDVQGKVDAQIAYGDPVNARKVVTVDDNTTYGIGLANFFDQDFKADGGTILGSRLQLTSNDVAKVGSLADQIKALGPDAVFFGGVAGQGAGALKKQLAAKGFNKPLVGGDGIATDVSYLNNAGDAGVDTYATTAAPGLSKLTSAAATKFQSDYQAFVAGKPNNTLIPYSAQSYDATMVIITAIKNLIKANKEVTRLNVRDEVAKIHYDGLTGSIYFDSNGDNAGPKVFSIFTIDATKQWVFKDQVSAS